MDRECYLEIERGIVVQRIERREVTPAGSVGIASGSCPGCRVEPFRVVGCDVPQDDAGVRKAGGRCVACNDAVGFIYARGYGETIFGAEEDIAMTTMARARVYGMEVPRG